MTTLAASGYGHAVLMTDETGMAEQPAVVLLHSGVADHRMWDTQVAALRDRYRVLAPDLRGFGARSHEPGPFSHAGDVLALLDSEERDEADTLGGLIFTLVDRVPTRGEVVPHPAGLEFEVLDADPRRITRVRIRRRPPAD